MHPVVPDGLWVPGASLDSCGSRDRHCQHGRLGEAAMTEVHCYCPPPPPPPRPPPPHPQHPLTSLPHHTEVGGEGGLQTRSGLLLSTALVWACPRVLLNNSASPGVGGVSPPTPLDPDFIV